MSYTVLKALKSFRLRNPRIILAPGGAYWLLDTDYDNWASVYACEDVLDVAKIEYGWVLTREIAPAPDVVSRT